ncbi:hypothetical protein HanXRQr2_Chr16g0763041 [Helianthus annuus]|uniref:Uncharacterized protein n=1 Tax=Helianthus annuus TaxID=4232 RepID=A0A9K3DTC9_HELAN|nr:hypothetical protein HanXRQr2_Chr16g0763041 [Helianthus annuus]KAJ0444154.1 hypothetical protein HanIR_Chr16g0828701 [Helianthus annuus]KAJ0461507.1 hypothetical protein HanHA89_Chr16g0673021 [Helianthus annuus]KAJ0641930.1 hypothetical protein HanLR1_Chr16g0632661 [Helianthus annuus]KAJ0645804.1 hypothetical protein HanOQP8_Chr16g0627991 [Helianthus annuus]
MSEICRSKLNSCIWIIWLISRKEDGNRHVNEQSRYASPCAAPSMICSLLCHGRAV